MLRLERVTPTGSRTVHFKRIGRSALLFGRLQRRARQPGPRARTSCLSFSCTSSFASVKLRCAKSPCGGATPRGWRGAGRWHGERRGRGTRGRQEERGQAQRCCTRNAPEPRARWRITDLVRDLAALSRLPPPRDDPLASAWAAIAARTACIRTQPPVVQLRLGDCGGGNAPPPGAESTDLVVGLVDRVFARLVGQRQRVDRVATAQRVRFELAAVHVKHLPRVLFVQDRGKQPEPGDSACC